MRVILDGDGVEKPALMSRVQGLGLNNVHFLPPVSKRAIPTLFDCFDCCYMGGMDSPLYRFGLSANKLFDYMMAAKPIVLALNAPTTVSSEFQCGIEVPPTPISNVVEAIDVIASPTDD